MASILIRELLQTLSKQRHAATAVDLVGQDGSAGPFIQFGVGTPEGAVVGIIGCLFLRTDGGATTTLYVKTSGSGNTGWTAK